MKIVFICGCLEEGKDGVGDYAKRLAKACLAKGHQAAIVSINDYGVDYPQSIDQEIPFLRLPNALNDLKQERLLKKFIECLKPDFISLQFVCYSFHRKGICWNMPAFIDRIASNTPLHIMAHELWIGAHLNAPSKEYWVGKIQKYFILKIFEKAAIIHTHLPTYQFLLHQEALKSELLPLFSNIPIEKGNASEALLHLLQCNNIKINSENRSDFLIFSFLGSIYRNVYPTFFFKQLEEIKTRTKKKILCLSLGYLGSSQKIWDQIVKNNEDKFQFIKIQDHSERTLSLCLQAIDFGIATTPLSLIQKSGSVAILKEHGVRIIICRNDVSFEGFSPQIPSNQFYLLDDNLNEFLDSWRKPSPHDSLTQIALSFTNSLEYAKS